MWLSRSFRRLAAPPQTEDGDEFGAVRLDVGAVDSLPEDVSGRATGHEVVALVEGLAEVVDLGFLSSGAQDEVIDNKGGFGHQCFHVSLKVPKQA